MVTAAAGFIRTYLERDVPMFGPRIPAETLERLWTMLAHNQGTLLNASRLAAGLNKAFLVYSGQDRYPKGDGIEAIDLRELAAELAALR